MLKKAQVRKIILPIHIGLISGWTILAVTLFVMTFFFGNTTFANTVYYSLLLPLGIGGMMTGMMMAFMLFRNPFKLKWLMMKAMLSMVIMVVTSIWLRKGIELDDYLIVTYSSIGIILMLLAAILLSIYKPTCMRFHSMKKKCHKADKTYN